MSSWLDLSNSSNKLKQTYVSGFVDISGQGVNIRNGGLQLFDRSNISHHSFSINADAMNIYDGVGTYTDVSNSKLIFLKDVSENIQSRLNDLTHRAHNISTDLSNSETNFSGNVNIIGNLITNYPVDSIPQSAIKGGVGGIYIPTEVTTFDDDMFAIVKEFHHGTTTIDASVNGNLSVSGNSILQGNVYLTAGVYLYGDMSMIGNVHVPTQPLEDSSDKIATTSYVQNTLFRQFSP